MENILIHTENRDEINLLKEIAKKMGFKAEILSISDKEDIGLAKAIEENKGIESLSFSEAISYYKSLDKAK
ncbi:hypothetical protein FA046_11525 [Pedobacter cryophilus]|uniref:Uncharacterized protein n=2 Tax=Pedobacter cryophilus TaxID=2571271 RepID=A0A4U1BWM0_9SPHI|nr:hypothetical protein FA046_11525 [Pedobacter cryophilus]